MQEFKFAIDVKYTCWDRYTLKVNAPTYEEAVREINEKYFDETGLTGAHINDSFNVESVGDIEYLRPEENNGECTELLHFGYPEKILWDNVNNWVPDIHKLKTT